jgi:hypothetical protein
MNSARKNTTTEIFKFQDENGQWHFGNAPFDQHIPSESTTYRSDTNIIVPAKILKPTNSPKPTQITSDPTSNLPLSVFTTPGNVEKLIEDAQQLQGRITERNNTMDNIIDSN